MCVCVGMHLAWASLSLQLLGTACIVAFTLILSWLNYLGLDIMGWPLASCLDVRGQGKHFVGLKQSGPMNECSCGEVGWSGGSK